jgi:hypothetical protein
MVRPINDRLAAECNQEELVAESDDLEWHIVRRDEGLAAIELVEQKLPFNALRRVAAFEHRVNRFWRYRPKR